MRDVFLEKMVRALIKRDGLTEDLRAKINVFYLLGSIGEDAYREFVGAPEEPETVTEE